MGDNNTTIAATLNDIKRLLRSLSDPDDGIIKEKWYMMPNLVNDILDYYLTPTEVKVLHRVIRDIYGWKKRPVFDQNIVSISKMVAGKISDDGKIQCLPLGLSRGTIEQTLQKLCEYGIIKKESRKQQGVVYAFNDHTDEYNIEKLIERVEERKTSGRQRMIDARKKNPLVKGDV